MRNKEQPYPSIIHLKILMGLYQKIHSIPLGENSITEEQYLGALKKYLREDFQLNQKTIGVVYKLIGRPSRVQELYGINLDLLERITKYVSNWIGLQGIFNTSDIKFYWHTFNENISVPPELDLVTNFHYYKDLFQNKPLLYKVDMFCERKIEELYAHFIQKIFVVYFQPNSEYSKTPGIIMFDTEKQIAIYRRFEISGGKLNIISTQRVDRTDGYFLFNSSLFLSFMKQKVSEINVPTHFALSVLDPTLNYSPSFIRGILLSSVFRATAPVSEIVILQRVETYSTALNSIKNELVPNEIHNELLRHNQIITKLELPPMPVSD